MPRLTLLAAALFFTANSALALSPVPRPLPPPAPPIVPAMVPAYPMLVGKIVEGKTTAERGLAITNELDRVGIKYRLEPFTSGEYKGNNIIAEIPGYGTKELLIGAHYDRVEKGDGAVDNASSSAAVLTLVQRLRAPEALKNYRVKVVFFDLEEKGLLGSKAYVEMHKDALPDIAVNMDVFGYGDTLWVMTPVADSHAATSARKVTDTRKFPAIIGEEYPPSDHLPFIAAGVQTISLSLLDGEEIKSIVRMFQGEKLTEVPRVFGLIHTENDTMAQIDELAVARGINVAEAVIRQIDDGATP